MLILSLMKIRSLLHLFLLLIFFVPVIVKEIHILCISVATTPEWERHICPDPPLMFRPLLRLVQQNHKGTRSNTVPQPQLLVSPNTGPKISFQEYVVGLKYTIEKLWTAGWVNFSLSSVINA